MAENINLDLANLPENVRVEVLQELAKRIADAKNVNRKVSFHGVKESSSPAKKNVSPPPSHESNTSDVVDQLDTGNATTPSSCFNIMGLMVGSQTVYLFIILLIVGIIMYFMTSGNKKRNQRKINK